MRRKHSRSLQTLSLHHQRGALSFIFVPVLVSLALLERSFSVAELYINFYAHGTGKALFHLPVNI